MSHADGSFVTLIKNAVRSSIEQIRASTSTETLAGYALLTDDELGTLAHLAVTREALRASSNPDLLFSPTNWPYEADRELFREANDRLRAALSRADDLGSHVDHAFAVLVEVLSELRAEGTVEPDVFLSVLSTDPSDHLLELEAASVRRLNEAETVGAREKFIAKWS